MDKYSIEVMRTYLLVGSIHYLDSGNISQPEYWTSKSAI